MLDQFRIPNETLVSAGLDLMRQAGKPLERVPAKGRAMIYRTPASDTVRVRTCNDHVLIVLADKDDLDEARLNIEGTDYVLIVMPERPRTPGPTVGYLVPTDVVSTAARSAQRAWFATNPRTNGDNRTWLLRFDTNGLPETSNFREKWRAYRLGGASSTDPQERTVETPLKKLGEVIAQAKQAIADAAGVPIERIKVGIDA
jgi:hypothetical protein